MEHYKVTIDFTASVLEDNRYIPIDYHDEFYIDLPNYFKIDRKKLFYDLLECYYGLHPIDVSAHSIEVIKL